MVGEYRNPPEARGWHLRRGVRGRAADHRQAGRGQGAEPALRLGPGDGLALRRRGPRRQQDPPAQHHRHLLVRDAPRHGPALLRDGAARRDDAGRAPRPDRRLPVALVQPIVRGIADALDAVHESGITHRDLKPDNVFLARERGRELLPKLLDFGIAKLLARDVAHKTGSGMCWARPRYMSPEQARGKRSDHRADIYALGVMIHEMLTGAPLFEGDSAVDMLLKQAVEDPAPMSSICPDLPRELDAPVLAMLAKRPDGRPSTAGKAVAALAACAQRLGLDRADVTLGELAADGTPHPQDRPPFTGTTVTVSGSPPRERRRSRRRRPADHPAPIRWARPSTRPRRGRRRRRRSMRGPRGRARRTPIPSPRADRPDHRERVHAGDLQRHPASHPHPAAPGRRRLHAGDGPGPLDVGVRRPQRRRSRRGRPPDSRQRAPRAAASAPSVAAPATTPTAAATTERSATEPTVRPEVSPPTTAQAADGGAPPRPSAVTQKPPVKPASSARNMDKLLGDR